MRGVAHVSWRGAEKPKVPWFPKDAFTESFWAIGSVIE